MKSDWPLLKVLRDLCESSSKPLWKQTLRKLLESSFKSKLSESKLSKSKLSESSPKSLRTLSESKLTFVESAQKASWLSLKAPRKPFKNCVNRKNTTFRDKIAYVSGSSFRRRPCSFWERCSHASPIPATLTISKGKLHLFQHGLHDFSFKNFKASATFQLFMATRISLYLIVWSSDKPDQWRTCGRRDRAPSRSLQAARAGIWEPPPHSWNRPLGRSVERGGKVVRNEFVPSKKLCLSIKINFCHKCSQTFGEKNSDLCCSLISLLSPKIPINH